MKVNDLIKRLDWKKQAGLVPCVVQDVGTGAVLMVAYVTRESLQATDERGRMVFYSRRRQALWEKGATSGNWMEPVGLYPDCDCDTVLAQVKPHGPACHRGTASCFDQAPLPPSGYLGELEEIVNLRRTADPQKSYTAKLQERGVRYVAQKVGEEAVEAVIAAVSSDRQGWIEESADLFYHWVVLTSISGVLVGEVMQCLQLRHEARGKAPPVRG